MDPGELSLKGKFDPYNLLFLSLIFWLTFNAISALSINIQKTKIMAYGPITSWEIDGETVSDFYFLGAPKSLQMVIAAVKLKDAYSLEGKL